jgi:hypothetical protein
MSEAQELQVDMDWMALGFRYKHSRHRICLYIRLKRGDWLVFSSASHISPLKTYEAKVTIQPTVSHAFKPQLGPKTTFLLLSDGWGFIDVGRSL